jgi:hypothetical protein
MTKVEEHRIALAGLEDWMPYIDANSGLPGPRGNLELVAACAEEADSTSARDLIGTGTSSPPSVAWWSGGHSQQLPSVGISSGYRLARISHSPLGPGAEDHDSPCVEVIHPTVA